MIEPIGVEQDSVVTSLGTMVYYSPRNKPWRDPETGEKEKLDQLLFFHGFGGGSSAYEWSKVYPAFASEYEVIAPDLLGWGRSDHPERNYTPEDYLQTLTEFISKKCTNPVPVVASSLTAALIIRLAVEHPELFQCLILTTPAGLSDFGEDYSRSFFAQLISTPVLDKALYTLGVASYNGIASFLENRQFAHKEKIYPEIIQAYLQSATRPNAEYAALSFVRGDLCFDLSHYVPQLQTPTAIIWGQKSQFTGPEIGRRLAALNPQAIRFFQELPEVGLTPQLESPEVTTGLIKLYLQQLR